MPDSWTKCKPRWQLCDIFTNLRYFLNISGTYHETHKTFKPGVYMYMYVCVCARIITMYKAACVQSGLTSCHFKVFAVRVTKYLHCTSAIPVCLSVSSDFSLSLPPSVNIFTCQGVFLSGYHLKLFFLPLANYLALWCKVPLTIS